MGHPFLRGDNSQVKSTCLGIVSEFVSARGWKLQLADAFPWACGEPTSHCVPLVVSPDQADPAGRAVTKNGFCEYKRSVRSTSLHFAASFRFHPTLIVVVLI